MISFQTLKNTSPNELLEVFNSSFSDYIVPFHLTLEQLEGKIKSDGIRLEFSVGAFEEDKLIAFILHGFDVIDGKKVIYNAGTGVIPEKRGNKLTVRLYEYILPLFEAENIDIVRLEVITENSFAIKAYENIGFEIIRKLDCYKGSVTAKSPDNTYEIKDLESYPWEALSSFWDWKPSWQNSIKAVDNIKESNISIGIYDGNLLLAYLIFNPKSKRIQQFSVAKEHRKIGLGNQLFDYITAKFGKEVFLINVDSNSEETSSFLTSLGLEKYVVQYEMELQLK